MEIVLAPDSFKESLTALEVCAALERGLRQVWPDVVCTHVPMADGGEGTVRSLVDATGGRTHTTRVRGPLGDPVDALWGTLGDGRTAVVEMAEASGLHLVRPGLRDPRSASTFGTGELVRAALDAGARRVVIGLGGSATNDAGAGLAQALGVRLLDADGNELPPGGAALARLARIDTSAADPRLADLEVEVACDVTNRLCGPEGASAVYGPQKGADEQCVRELDAALATFGERVRADVGRDVTDVPGAGAAGGLGAGLLAFTGAELRRGIDIVVDHTGLEAAVARADLVITGEGRMDGQTRFGKTPWGVAQVARRHGVPVVAIAGSLGDDVEELYAEGFTAVIACVDRVAPLEDVLAGAADSLTRTARNVAAALSVTLPD
ncbi:glycerate kinase [Mariniluteicoccus endophyticus]